MAHGNTYLPARLNLGFTAGPKYAGWQPGRRNILKDAIKTDVYDKTTAARRIEWKSVVLSAHFPDRITDDEVKDCITIELAKTLTDDFTISLTTDIHGDDLPVDGIIYIWYEGQRYCQHTYLVSYEDTVNGGPTTDWEVADAYEPARMKVTLSWATAI